MGVRPVGRASNQTGNLHSSSISPPAPSLTLRARTSIRKGLSATWLTGTRSLSARGPAKAEATTPP